MRIVDLDVRMIRVDASEWYGDNRPPAEPIHWDYPLVTVTTEEGRTGHSMGYGAKGEGWPIAEYLRRIYRPRLIGSDAREIEKIWQREMAASRHLYGATHVSIGIIDVALWVFAGKVAGLPIATLLGAAPRRLPTYRTISRFKLATDDEVEANLARAGEGVHGVKVQVWDGPGRDIPRLRAARRILGNDVVLMHDAAGQYDLADALQVGRALTDLDYHWFEEPIPDAQITNLAYLRRSVGVPIVTAETASLRQLTEYVQAGAADALRGDVLIKGGITGLRKAVAFAELNGLRLEIHTGGTPLLDVANLHVAAATHNVTFVETHHDVFRFGLVGEPLAPDSDGYVSVPGGPGLGIELDMDWIDDHTVAA